MTTLDRLYKKGLLQRSKRGRAFVYKPAFSENDMERGRASEMVHRLFSNSSMNQDALLSCLVDAVESYDTDLLHRLEEKVRVAKEQHVAGVPRKGGLHWMLLSYWLRLACLVLFGVGIVQVVLSLLSMIVMGSANRSIDRMSARCQERIRFAIPVASQVIALLLVLLVIAPQYIRNETNQLQERVGIVCVVGTMLVVARYLYGLFKAAYFLLQELQAYKLDGVPAVLTGGAPVHISEDVHPLLAVTGMFSPRIVVSRHLLSNAALSQEQLEIALAHENAHVSHRDNLKYFVLASLAFFRPGAKGSLRRWRYAAEIAADDDAVSGNSSRAILLAETLLVAARTVPPRRAAALSLGLLPHEEELDKRIDRLLRDDSFPTSTITPGWRHIMSAVALLLTGACALLQLFAASFHEIAEYVLHLG